MVGWGNERQAEERRVVPEERVFRTFHVAQLNPRLDGGEAGLTHQETDGRPRALHCGRLEQSPIRGQSEQPVKMFR